MPKEIPKESIKTFFEFYLKGHSLNEIVRNPSKYGIDVHFRTADYWVNSLGVRCLNLFHGNKSIDPIYIMGYETMPSVRMRNFFYCYAFDIDGIIRSMAVGLNREEAFKLLGDKILGNLHYIDVNIYGCEDDENVYFISSNVNRNKRFPFVKNKLVMGRNKFASLNKVLKNVAIFSFLHNCRVVGVRDGMDYLLEQGGPYPIWKDLSPVKSKLVPKKSSLPYCNPLAPVSGVFLWGTGVLRAGQTTSRPRFRSQCVGMPRPCPYVGCKHNMYIKEIQKQGTELKLTWPNLEPWEVDGDKSCSLDVADNGVHTLDEISKCMNLTRERIRQIESKAKKKAYPKLKKLRGKL
ncbi:MAG: hypothetical protein KAS32_20135 [Candidatus Peribacteraceae bacterium]|nr:hypothetical protein [Candidatus Peribacteraceae bacterium]